MEQFSPLSVAKLLAYLPTVSVVSDAALTEVQVVSLGQGRHLKTAFRQMASVDVAMCVNTIFAY